jgi:hypothetical protein
VTAGVRDEVGEHLAQARRVAAHEGHAVRLDVHRRPRERRRKHRDVDLLETERRRIRIGDDPLDVARSRDPEREHPS